MGKTLAEKKYELAVMRLSAATGDEPSPDDLIISAEEEIRADVKNFLSSKDGDEDKAFSSLLSIADWTDFEIHCLIMGYETALRPACIRACERLSSGGLCAEILMLTYEGEITPSECYLALNSHSLLSRYIWEDSVGSVMERRLQMQEWLVNYIISGRLSMPLAEMFEKNEVHRTSDSDTIRHATRMDCPFTMDDIVIPDNVASELKLACDQVRLHDRVYKDWEMDKIVSYGKGVSILLSGAPGTGKTMAAQILANEIGMPLYRISLPGVVSKYIGETEKNLNEIFDRASGMHVILFFDEADVLFAKRTEIRDGNDKYSNMEAAFLLQKIEDYDGVTILATNYRQNFDEAFSRRLKFVVDFPFPGEAERAKIWEKAIPKKLMNPSIDTAYLGRKFELAGAHIKNVAIHASFLVAAAGRETLTMADLTEAVRHEYAKLGKVMTAKELGDYYVAPDER